MSGASLVVRGLEGGGGVLRGKKDMRICILGLRKGNKEKECFFVDPSQGRREMRPVGELDLSC